jgi:hypothetical protein
MRSSQSQLCCLTGFIGDASPKETVLRFEMEAPTFPCFFQVPDQVNRISFKTYLVHQTVQNKQAFGGSCLRHLMNLQESENETWYLSTSKGIHKTACLKTVYGLQFYLVKLNRNAFQVVTNAEATATSKTRADRIECPNVPELPTFRVQAQLDS